MNSSSAPASPTAPTLPLSNALRSAYQTLYEKLQTAVENTTDLATLEALNAALPQVDDVLTKDRIYRLDANTAAFQALLQQIADTNEQLKQLQQQVSSVASRIGQAGDVIAAVEKVFSFLPGA